MMRFLGAFAAGCVLLAPVQLPPAVAQVRAHSSGAIGALNVQLKDLPAGTERRDHTTRVTTTRQGSGCGSAAGGVILPRLRAFDGAVYFSSIRIGTGFLTAYIGAVLGRAASVQDAHRLFLSERHCRAPQLAHAKPTTAGVVGDEHAAIVQACTVGSQELQGYVLLFRRRAYVEFLSVSTGCPAGASQRIAAELRTEANRLARLVDARILAD